MIYLGGVSVQQLSDVFGVKHLALGWLAARAIRMNTPDTRAVTIEIGMQNSGLGLALILNQFDALGGAALIAAGWGIWHIISGSLLAALWKRSDLRAATP